MATKNLYFTIVDYALFVSTLLISMSIGVYYQCKKQTTDELLTGNRKMPLIPTAMSLMASFVSGIAFLGLPAELYTMGAGVIWYLAGTIIADILTVLIFIPVLYNVKGISIYSYLEERFDSKFLRLYASFLFTVTVLLWNSVALYAPSIALAKVTGFPTWIMILSVGLICTLYTAMGGLKAVVWTDTIQAVIMYGGLVAAVIKGTLAVGFAPEIFNKANSYGRLDGLTNVDPSPFQSVSIWIGIFGGTFNWMSGYGASQLAQQRYRSLPSVRRAQFVALMNIPIVLLIYFLIYYNGFLMFAYYNDCDPLQEGVVESRDQLLVYYTMDLLGSIYGLPGLFLASICSATLSTISSGVNAMAAVALDDYVRALWPKLDKSKEVMFSKIISLVLGLLVTCLAFAAEPLGGIFVATQKVIGVLSGPLVGLMLLGILIRKVEKVGASVGTVVGTLIILWIFIGATITDVHFNPLPTSIDGCDAQNITYIIRNVTDQNLTQKAYNIYGVSFGLYPVIGAVPVLIVGPLVSFVWKRHSKIWSVPETEVQEFGKIEYEIKTTSSLHL